MTVLHIAHPSLEQRQARGVQASEHVPVESHRGWKPAEDRPDPVSLLEEQDKSREEDLVPVRHGRMMFSPFTFYRGAARIMAADLASTPTAGLDVQLCGDAHLSNFGAYASPERQLLFDLNDFDETLPGPFEYDVKRLAASFTIAARNNGFTASEGRDVTRAVVEAYRTTMAGFSTSDTLDVWYAKLSEDELVRGMDQVRQQAAKLGRAARKRQSTAQAKDISVAISRGKAALKKAHGRTNLQALSKLTEVVDGRARIASQPPVLIPFRELAAYYGLNPDEADIVVTTLFDRYRATLSPARRVLLDRFRVVDVARKVVGVGSVGPRSFVVLLE